MIGSEESRESAEEHRRFGATGCLGDSVVLYNKTSLLHGQGTRRRFHEYNYHLSLE